MRSAILVVFGFLLRKFKSFLGLVKVLSIKKKNQLLTQYEKLTLVTCNKNTWFFVDELSSKMLAGIEEKNDFSLVEKRCDFGKEKALLIKQNPVRQVFQGEHFYYKRTFKDDGSLFLEFKRTLLLNKLGIPCVKCAALGFTSDGVFLVTKAQKDTFQLDKYLEQASFDEKMLASFQDFLSCLLEHKVSHTDLHLGNILYNPKENKFYLVDVLKCKITSSSLWYNLLDKKKILRVFCFVRDKLLFSTIEKLLFTCKIATPKIFYNSQIKKEAKHVFKEWPKRKRQVLTGYEKFSRREGDMLYLSIATENKLQDAEIILGSASYLVADIFLGLMRIPHRRVLAVNLVTNQVWLENVNNSIELSVEVVKEYQTRLEDILHVETSLEDWCSSDIYPVIFTGYEKIVNLLLFSVK